MLISSAASTQDLAELDLDAVMSTTMLAQRLTEDEGSEDPGAETHSEDFVPFSIHNQRILKTSSLLLILKRHSIPKL